MTETAKPVIATAGAGRMGQGIAQVFAHGGYAVTMIDLKQRPTGEARETGTRALGEIERTLGFLASLDVITEAQAQRILGRISFIPAGGAEQALAGAGIIFEGVPEVLEIKQQALGLISRAADPGALIASTTSTMLVTQLAGFVTGPERFLNAHWLNPAYLIPLVEVSPGPATTEATVERLMALLGSIGKVPVRCAASPGYIVPRLQAAAMNEAARMVEDGVASPAEIDQAVRVGFGLRYASMGLLEFIDWGGVDILYYATNYLNKALDAERFQVPEIIEKMMRDGRLGMREGQGFYDFSEMDVDAYQRQMLSRFVTLLKQMELLPPAAD
ncbi:MAG: 3-hydroxybutyryl-CoA dehydrogenase [Rhodospirillales bacterium]|jgi:3-hydroxybutyryl-CoA dehydrogenase|nr:3-hydroxybutyryl-CoA dehydrogenase [Rhodospirillales bacterium]